MSMDFHGHLLIFMDWVLAGLSVLSVFMDIHCHGFPLHFIDFDEWSWIFVVFKGCASIFIDVHRCSCIYTDCN